MTVCECVVCKVWMDPSKYIATLRGERLCDACLIWVGQLIKEASIK